MKKSIIKLVTLFSLLSLVSCSQGVYYQLVNTRPITKGLEEKEKAIVYEDDNCVVNYDFWAPGGSMQIIIENKTEEDIYLDLSASFFIFNNFAYDLYSGRTNTTSVVETSGSRLYWGMGLVSDSRKSTHSSEVTVQHKIITIPAKMHKVITETDVYINQNIHRDCNLLLLPKQKDVKSSTFTLSDTPYTFGLRIAYYVGDNPEPVKFRNEFYVDRITNYPIQMFKSHYDDKTSVCPDETIKSVRKTMYNYKEPGSFFIKYNSQVGVGAVSGVFYKH